MLDKLVDFIRDFIGWFKFAAFMHSYERGVLLRFGKPVDGDGGRFRPKGCLLEPGKLYLHWPLKVEEALHHTVVEDGSALPEQTLTTKDGDQVTLTPVVTYEVPDVEAMLLTVGSIESALLIATTGALSTLAVRKCWAEIAHEDFANEVTKKARIRARRWGVHVVEVQFRDMTRCRTIRLIQGQQAQKDPNHG